MSSNQVVVVDILRTLAHASISGSYAAVGIPFTFQTRLVCFTNNTDGDMLFSDDGVNDKLFIAANSFKLFDLVTNKTNPNPTWCMAPGTQWYVKQSTAPSKNSVYIECLG